MANNRDISKIDWITILLYFTLVAFGWVSIYATLYIPGEANEIFDFEKLYSKQLMWILTSVLIIISINIIDFRFYETFSYLIYGIVIFLLLFVLVAGTKVAGSLSWISIGGFRLQPAEFAKFSVALALAKYMSQKNKPLKSLNEYLIIGALIILPIILILLQGDTGSALVFVVFVLVLYREGLSPAILIIGVLSIFLFILTLVVDKMFIFIGIGVIVSVVIFLFRKYKSTIYITLFAGVFAIGLVFSVDFLINNALKPHQQNRIKILINPDSDPMGAGYQVTQAKIAIGSGGFLGKGFLNGTQTKGDFIPDNHTDNIFCTIGEEFGFVGSFIFISLFIALLVRIITLAEQQKSKFSRVYGYSVASVLFFHFLINVGMTIGFAPVIGIPLPYISYGGSALWSFTIMLFIFLKLDAHKDQILTR